MQKILKYYKPYIFKVLICLIIKISGIVMELLIPILLSYLLDTVVPNKSMGEIVFYGFLMIGAACLGFLGNCKANQRAAYIAKTITISLRQDLFRKIMSLSERQIDEITLPSLVARMSSDTYNIHQMLAMLLRLGVRAPILFFGGMIATLFLDPILTLVIVATLPLVGLLLYLISKISISLFTDVQKAIDKMVLSLRENITGIRVIKALSKEDYEKGRFDAINKNVIKYELKSSSIMTALNPCINLILNIGLVGVIIVGAYRVNNGIILPGKVLAFTTYFSMIVTALISLNRMFTIISKAYASILRIDYVFDMGKTLTKENHEGTSKAYIEFRNVSFSYLGEKNNLENISFKLSKGETLGIIGSTGSGKTTIINLLLRLYDVNKGAIYINGKDVRNYSDKALRKKFGASMQYDHLFKGTIKENIDFFRGIKDKEIEQTIKTAQIDFIDNYDDKINHQVAPNGTNFSGGQKQRLLLARALASYPDILILDDASSALDYKTDERLRHAIKENYPSVTSIIVSARISSIKHAETIIVLENEKINGIGTHESLLATNKIYKEIYDLQLGGDEYDE